MTELRKLILSEFLVPETLPYYRKLFDGGYSFEATMRAHLQDLARSIASRGLREIQLRKLDLLQASNSLAVSDCLSLREVIEDELPGPGRRSHFDVRIQMFSHLGLPVEHLETIQPLPDAAEAARIFRSIFVERELLEITAAVGAIEMWYIPLAERLERTYLALGYSTSQVATYSLHKTADINHSDVAISFVEKYADPKEYSRILEAVRLGFESVRLYDVARFKAASDTTIVR